MINTIYVIIAFIWVAILAGHLRGIAREMRESRYKLDTMNMYLKELCEIIKKK